MVLSVLGIVARTALLPRQPLWADEAFSLALATGHSLEHRQDKSVPSLGDFVEPRQSVSAATLQNYLTQERLSVSRIIRATRLSDTNPPLYYILLGLWAFWGGTSDIALRSFSLILNVASLFLLATLMRRITTPEAALAGAALFAVSPWLIFYSVEVRMYSLMVFLASLNAFLTVPIREGKNLFWIPWAIVSAAGLWTHYFYVFPLAGITLYLFVFIPSKSRVYCYLSLVAVILMVTPWYSKLPSLLGEWRVSQGWELWRPATYGLVKSPLTVASGWFSCRTSPPWNLWSNYRLCNGCAFAAFAAAAIIGGWRGGSRWFDSYLLLPGLWFLAAALGPTAFDLLRHSFISMIPRYSICAAPPALALAGVSLSYIRPAGRRALLVIIFVAWLPILSAIFNSPSRFGPSAVLIAGHVNKQCERSDVVIIDATPSDILAVSRYLRAEIRVLPWVQQLRGAYLPSSIDEVGLGIRRILLVRMKSDRPSGIEAWLQRHGEGEHNVSIGTASVSIVNLVESNNS